MKKIVLLILSALILTSCNSNDFTEESFWMEQNQSIKTDYNTSTFKKEFPFYYEPYENYIDSNFSNYSYFKLFPKDSVYNVLYPYENTVYKVGCETTKNKIYFIEIFDVINDELRSMDLTSGGSDSYTGPSRETLQFQCVFYPTLSDKRDYKLVVDYFYPKATRVKIEGNGVTFGYIFCYCRTDISEYKNIFLKYVDKNLKFHSKKE